MTLKCAAYRRANPGSKLKTAVTGKVKKEVKLKRKSFCARSGVKPRCIILTVERHQTKEFVKQEGDGNVRHEYDMEKIKEKLNAQ